MENIPHWPADAGDLSKTPSPWGSPRMTAPGRCFAQDDDFLCVDNLRVLLSTAPAAVGRLDEADDLLLFPDPPRPASRSSSCSTTQGLGPSLGARPGSTCPAPDEEPTAAASEAATRALSPDGDQGTAVRRELSSASEVEKRKKRNVLANIDQEIAETRSRLQEQRARILDLHKKHEESVVEERQEWEMLKMKREADRKKQSEQAIKMQRHLRGWLVRRRFILSIHKQTTEHINWAALLPTQLELQLSQLQHMLHGLKYTDQCYLKAALALQSWWRAVRARRLVAILRIRSRLVVMHRRMDAAAIKMQARFRGRLAHKAWHGEICLAMAKKWMEEQKAMQRGLDCVVKIQRNIRAKIESRRYDALRQQFAEEQSLLDTKLLRVSRHMAFISTDGLSRQLAPTTKDHALQELEMEGLTPFHWRASSNPFMSRHRIGGPLALEMPEAGDGAADDAASSDRQIEHSPDNSSFLEKLPDVYLSGFSPDFVKRLDDDVWPRDPWDRARGQSESSTKPAQKRSNARQKASRKSSRRICAAPFSHTEQRAGRVRAERAPQPELASRQEEEAVPPHPLFVNAPALPPPPGRPSPAARLRHVNSASTEECSWPAATKLSPLRVQRTLPLSGVVA